MLNYEVDPALLRPLVPAGTELDFWQGRALVSVVAFRFLDTRLRGVPIPLHRDFDGLADRLKSGSAESAPVSPPPLKPLR